MSEPNLLRVVLDFSSAELSIRCLYRSENGPNPSTKRRKVQIQDLVRDGLQDALDGLQTGRVDVVGSSGFSQREDVLSVGAKRT
jgi:hypothetical protein